MKQPLYTASVCQDAGHARYRRRDHCNVDMFEMTLLAQGVCLARLIHHWSCFTCSQQKGKVPVSPRTGTQSAAPGLCCAHRKWLPRVHREAPEVLCKVSTVWRGRDGMGAVLRLSRQHLLLCLHINGQSWVESPPSPKCPLSGLSGQAGGR